MIGCRECVVLKKEVQLVAEHLGQFRFVPGIEAAFLALAVRVEAGGKTTAFNSHFPAQPRRCFFDSIPKQSIASFCKCPGRQPDKEGIVIKHFLEMRDEPRGVGGVSAKAAANVIVDATVQHVTKAVDHGIPVAWVSGGEPAVPEGFHERSVGKFGSTPQASFRRVDH